MKVKFHESLEALVSVVKAQGIPLDSGTVFLRDGVGRLTVAREGLSDTSRISEKIKDKLGEYASIRPVVTGAVAKSLVKDSSVIEIFVNVDGDEIRIRFVDRRFVGSDWMYAPKARVEGEAPRLAFYSLKGGVGRSTALSVLAADLAREGLKILAIDLDIEAPGIGFLLLEASENLAEDRRPKYGVLDYLVENGINGIGDEELYDFIGVKPFYEGSIHVVPVVGRITDENPGTMMAKLSRALIEDEGGGGPISFTRQVQEMVDRFSKMDRYDAILIDARAGMADASAPSVLALGADILFFGTDQPQTFRGYRYLFAHLLRCFGYRSEAFEKWRETISFVQAKAPSSSQQRVQFRERLHELCADFLYDEESLGDDGYVEPADFNFSVEDSGLGVPHDATYISYVSDYSAFDPVGDKSKLDVDVYRGPFGPFLERARQLLGLPISEVRR